jgi:hypothetical protein
MLQEQEQRAKTIDRNWAHQFALPADQAIGRGHRINREFCRESGAPIPLSLHNLYDPSVNRCRPAVTKSRQVSLGRD